MCKNIMNTKELIIGVFEGKSEVAGRHRNLESAKMNFKAMIAKKTPYFLVYVKYSRPFRISKFSPSAASVVPSLKKMFAYS